MKYSVSVLSLLLCCASQRTHARVGLGIEEKEAGQRITLPASETKELTHGICVTGASSAHAKSSNLEGLEYTAVYPFRDGTRAFDDREYKVEGIIFSPCAGGIFLRPSLHRKIDEGTVIEVTAIPDGSTDTKVCVYATTVADTTGFPRDGNWPTTLVNMGFIPYDSQGFTMYVLTTTIDIQANVFCKVLTKQKRCDDLFVLDNFDLITTTLPLENPSLGDTIIASYQNDGLYPINSGVYTITNVNYDSICTVVKAYGAPKCDIEMEITFCKAESCASTTMSGKFMASGTGPKPYAIYGGTGDLFAAGGTIDAELNVIDLALKNVKVNLCFNNRE